MGASVYQLKRVQTLPWTLDECWQFFSSPLNLPKITPAWLGFEVLNPTDEPMYPGMILQYYVTPLAGIKMRWVTEITHVEKNVLFVDEQRFGPYRMWHHQHRFRSVGDQTEMTDIVHYCIGYGPLDPLLNASMVRHRLEAIFDFRFQTMEEMTRKGSNRKNDRVIQIG